MERLASATAALLKQRWRAASTSRCGPPRRGTRPQGQDSWSPPVDGFQLPPDHGPSPGPFLQTRPAARGRMPRTGIRSATCASAGRWCRRLTGLRSVNSRCVDLYRGFVFEHLLQGRPAGVANGAVRAGLLAHIPAGPVGGFVDTFRHAPGVPFLDDDGLGPCGNAPGYVVLPIAACASEATAGMPDTEALLLKPARTLALRVQRSLMSPQPGLEPFSDRSSPCPSARLAASAVGR